MEDSDDQFSESTVFSYMEPFDTNLWLLILASTIVVSVGASVLGRLSPYGWYQSPPDEFSLWEARSQMRLDDTLWQSLSAILQQGNLKNHFRSLYNYTHNIHRCRNSTKINFCKNFNGRMVVCMLDT